MSRGLIGPANLGDGLMKAPAASAGTITIVSVVAQDPDVPMYMFNFSASAGEPLSLNPSQYTEFIIGGESPSDVVDAVDNYALLIYESIAPNTAGLVWHIDTQPAAYAGLFAVPLNGVTATS